MRKLAFSVLLASLSLSACSRNDPPDAAVEVPRWNDELPLEAPWLRAQLPQTAVSYLRLPHLLALAALPKGSMLDAALASEANVRNLLSIQQGIADNLAVELPPARLLDALRAPIEITAMAVPVPAALIGTTLSFRSQAEFEEFVGELGQALPVALGAPLDDGGFGQLTGLPLPLLVHFEESTGRLALFLSPVGDRDTFNALVNAPVAGAHAMHVLEAQIDQSGQGLFAWVDTAEGLQGAAMILPPDLMASLRAVGIDRARAVAAGAGVADRKGRLKVLADLGTAGVDRPIPVVANRIAASAVGEPRNLFLLSLPSVEEFSRIERLISSSAPAASAAGWSDAKAALAEVSGISVEDLLAAIGPEIVGFSDRAGDYFGLRVRDPERLADVAERLAASARIQIQQREVPGGSIRYVELPSTFDVRNEVVAAEVAPLLQVIARLRNRVYWLDDGDYWYLATTPQVLIDRLSLGADTSIAEWLRETQRIDTSSAVIAATAAVAHLPLKVYHAYLGSMQSLADIVDADFDIWAMPTANQLDLPERGTLGFSVSLGSPYVSVELTYESTPADLVFTGAGMAAVAGLGMVAAVAIPAYQDFVLRAESAITTDATESP